MIKLGHMFGDSGEAGNSKLAHYVRERLPENLVGACEQNGALLFSLGNSNERLFRQGRFRQKAPSRTCFHASFEKIEMQRKKITGIIQAPWR
jgi:hypothetical protein